MWIATLKHMNIQWREYRHKNIKTYNININRQRIYNYIYLAFWSIHHKV